MAVGEVGDEGRSLATVAAYTSGGDKLQMCYTFDLLGPEFSAAHVRKCVTAFEQQVVDGWICWAFSNHDVVRHVSRWTAAGRRHRDDGQIRDRAAGFAARLDLPLRGRGAGPAGGRDRLRGSARSLRHPLLAGLQGPRRLPHADALGKRPRRMPASRPASRGCRCRERIAPARSMCSRAMQRRCWRTIAGRWRSAVRIRRW